MILSLDLVNLLEQPKASGKHLKDMLKNTGEQ